MSRNAANFPTSVWNGSTPNRTARDVDRAPDYEDYDQLVAEVIAVQDRVLNGDGSFGAAAGTGNVAVDVTPALHQTTITLTAFAMAVASSAVGFVGTKVFDFPDGLIRILGAVMDLTITTDPVGTAIDDDALLSVSVGSVVAADDATLTSTEANIVPQTDFQLAAGTLRKTGLGLTAATLDGITTAAVDAYLNIVCPDADRTDVTESVTVTGTIKITWVNLGDT